MCDINLDAKTLDAKTLDAKTICAIISRRLRRAEGGSAPPRLYLR